MIRFVKAFCLLSCVSTASAQPYPSRNVRIIIGLSPGGSMDVTARLVADRLKESLGQQVIVENRQGANGVIASELVAKSPPDGHTLMLAGAGSLAIRHKLDMKLRSDKTLRHLRINCCSANAPELTLNCGQCLLNQPTCL